MPSGYSSDLFSKNMKVAIANPIYDVVFKYMMEDNAVA